MQAVVNALDVVNTISGNNRSGITLTSSPMNLIHAFFWIPTQLMAFLLLVIVMAPRLNEIP